MGILQKLRRSVGYFPKGRKVTERPYFSGVIGKKAVK